MLFSFLDSSAPLTIINSSIHHKLLSDMRQLRVIRIILAAFFLTSAIAFLVVGNVGNPMARISITSQIAQTSIGASLGASLIWLLMTLLFGRIYCSTVCPIGTLTDIFSFIARKTIRKGVRYSWKPAKKFSLHLMIVTVVCAIAGVTVVVFLLEPWNMMTNIASLFNIHAADDTWLSLAVGASTGVVAAIVSGAVSLAVVIAYAAITGRSFCTDICPLGTALSLLNDYNIYHIEIDPDRCTYCGRCEDVCPSHCIKVVSRYVDNSRCVRCFDCLAACRDNAIHYQANRNKRATPLLQKKAKA